MNGTLFDRFKGHKIRRCALVGSNGYLGSQLAYVLKALNIPVKLYDVQEHAIPALSGMPYARLDVTSPDAWRLFDWDVDVVFYFAGLTGTSAGFKDPLSYLRVNEEGLLNYCHASRQRDRDARPRIIFPSTRLVYKGAPSPLAEASEKETKTLYAVNKLACEGILYAYYNAYGCDYSIYRICVPYGNVVEGHSSYGTLGFFKKQLAEKGAITLYGDGSQRRTFTHVLDICYALVMLARDERTAGETFNIGGEDCSLHEAASRMASSLNGRVCQVPWPDFDWKLESGSTVFDDRKLRRLMPNYTTHTLKDEFARMAGVQQ